MNRRIRNRTYGGVGGGFNHRLPDYFDRCISVTVDGHFYGGGFLRNVRSSAAYFFIDALELLPESESRDALAVGLESFGGMPRL
jgi:hypothetical protein